MPSILSDGITHVLSSIVQVGLGARGGFQYPKSLADIKAFAKDMILDKPLPKWFFRIMDELEEVEASVTIEEANLRAISFVIHVRDQLTKIQNSSPDVHPVPSGSWSSK